ncbi:conserved hypothetical protein [Echinococcus multilocularis]|uniref:Uncharacterized protein n=1 Tax=Echinococcus multilocularis TaxID=6211 RepID=A0A068YFH3_ECHMU|nr:conserved hypothetical protein [Echinococcus multilocularis]
MKRCLCRSCESSLETHFSSLRIDTSSSEESNECVAQQGEEMVCDLLSPMHQAANSPPNSLIDESNEQNDTGFPYDFKSYFSEVSGELEQSKTPDLLPEMPTASSDHKFVKEDYWFRATSQSDHVDCCDEDSMFSDETCPCGRSTTSTQTSSSASSYKGKEAEEGKIFAEKYFEHSSCDSEDSSQMQGDVYKSSHSPLHRSSKTLQTLDYELYKCIMRMQEALDTAHRAVKKLRLAQSIVSDLGRDLNTSVDQVSTSLIKASAIKAKHAKFGGRFSASKKPQYKGNVKIA